MVRIPIKLKKNHFFQCHCCNCNCYKWPTWRRVVHRSVMSFARIISRKSPGCMLGAVLPCEANRQYLLTLKVSRYSLCFLFFAEQSSWSVIEATCGDCLYSKNSARPSHKTHGLQSPGSTRRWPTVVFMLCRRRRRRHKIKTTLGQGLVFTGGLLHVSDPTDLKNNSCLFRQTLSVVAGSWSRWYLSLLIQYVEQRSCIYAGPAFAKYS